MHGFTPNIGYQGFGSFHSENVEELLAQPPSSYLAPPDPFEDIIVPDCSFGKEMKRHFMLEEGWVFLNHGAFGAPISCVYDIAEKFRRYAERQPLRFIDRELFPFLVRRIRELSAFVGENDPSNLVILPNATTGLHTVITSIGKKLTSEDGVLYLNIGYGSVKKMVSFICQQTGAHEVVVDVPVPFTPTRLVETVRMAITATQLNIRLAIFDHITSNTAALLPVKELVALCHSTYASATNRKKSMSTSKQDMLPSTEDWIPVLIDGAHALGTLALDVPEIGADFYVANCHKWFLCPKGASFLWVSPLHKSGIVPPIVSHGFGSGFTSQFIWDGCRDYSSALSISAALKVWQTVGATRIREYCHSLVTEASAVLVKRWNTETLCSPDVHVFMSLVRLPDESWQKKGTKEGEEAIATSVDAKTVQDRLHCHHSIEVPIKVVNNRLWVRISAHIYNYLEEYEQLAAAVLQLNKEEA